jgi:hypothetical protein
MNAEYYVLVIVGVAAFISYKVTRDVYHQARALHQIRQNLPVTVYCNLLSGKRKLDITLFDKLPCLLIVALLLQEDVRFFAHKGFEWREIIRSLYLSLRYLKFKGGSSISQQTVKHLCRYRRRNARHPIIFVKLYQKFIQAILTLILERQFSKKEILSIYFQVAQWGTRTLGIEDASRIIFRKSYSCLNISEAILLVWLLTKPGTKRVNQVIEKKQLAQLCREVYEKSLKILNILHTLDLNYQRLFTEPSIIALQFPIDNRHSDVLIEQATEIVYSFKRNLKKYARTPLARVPLHYAFLNDIQRYQLSMLFGKRQLFSKRILFDALNMPCEIRSSSLLYPTGSRSGDDLINPPCISNSLSEDQVKRVVAMVVEGALTSNAQFILTGDANLILQYDSKPLIRRVAKLVFYCSEGSYATMCDVVSVVSNKMKLTSGILLVHKTSCKKFVALKDTAHIKNIEDKNVLLLSAIEEFHVRIKQRACNLAYSWQDIFDYRLLIESIGYQKLITYYSAASRTALILEFATVFFLYSQVSHATLPVSILKSIPVPRELLIKNIQAIYDHLLHESSMVTLTSLIRDEECLSQNS